MHPPPDAQPPPEGSSGDGNGNSARPGQAKTTPSLLTPDAARWELDGLSRATSARTVLDAIACGHWPAEAGTVDAAAHLLHSSAERFRWRDACMAGRP